MVVPTVAVDQVGFPVAVVHDDLTIHSVQYSHREHTQQGVAVGVKDTDVVGPYVNLLRRNVRPAVRAAEHAGVRQGGRDCADVYDLQARVAEVVIDVQPLHRALPHVELATDRVPRRAGAVYRQPACDGVVTAVVFVQRVHCRLEPGVDVTQVCIPAPLAIHRQPAVDRVGCDVYNQRAFWTRIIRHVQLLVAPVP